MADEALMVSVLVVAEPDHVRLSPMRVMVALMKETVASALMYTTPS